MAAQRMSPATISTYSTAVRQLGAHLADHGNAKEPTQITRDDIEAFITFLLARWKATTAHNRYRGLHAFFAWLVDEDEITIHPMTRMKPPRLPEAPPPVLQADEMQRLIDACAADKTFTGRRDEAVIRTFLDSGMRRGEMLGLRVTDVDLNSQTMRVTGKGSRTRDVGIGTQAVRAVDRYLRFRAKHRDADLPAMWLSRKGQLRESGLAELVRERGKQAGIQGLHPHLFRHAYADSVLGRGMHETHLMAIAGWKSREMVSHYAAANRTRRALEAARALSPGDWLAADDTLRKRRR